MNKKSGLIKFYTAAVFSPAVSKEKTQLNKVEEIIVVVTEHTLVNFLRPKVRATAAAHVPFGFDTYKVNSRP